MHEPTDSSREMLGHVSLLDWRRDQLEARLSADGVPAVHAAALWRVLYRSKDADVDPVTLPPPVRRWLSAAPDVRLPVTPAVVDVSRSTDERTEKVLLRLADRRDVETVTMGYPGRLTACVSTQVGCAMGCVFCATGQMGFVRHLTAGEIVAQALHAVRTARARGGHLRNVVLMGMGEPLHNYDAVLQALAIVSDRGGLNIGPSRITINTVGVVPGILRLAEERQPYHLGVSLHGGTEEERLSLVPASRRWPLAEVIDACHVYARATGKKIFIGWTLIRGINDSADHAHRLVTLLSGLPAHVNLIRLNTTPGFNGLASDESAGDRFRSIVQAAGVPCTIRQRRGIDVAAGCGQLATARRSVRHAML
jgi:23S rRNA (adenine2503-C2)-methyltransferase